MRILPRVAFGLPAEGLKGMPATAREVVVVHHFLGSWKKNEAGWRKRRTVVQLVAGLLRKLLPRCVYMAHTCNKGRRNNHADLPCFTDTLHLCTHLPVYVDETTLHMHAHMHRVHHHFTHIAIICIIYSIGVLIWRSSSFFSSLCV